MTDLAGVSFVPNRDPSLLLLSQETKTVAMLRLASNQSTNDDLPVTAAVVGSLVVPDEEANQPEGVAWDHDRRRLWVVGEPNELLLWAEDCAAFPRGATGRTTVTMMVRATGVGRTTVTARMTGAARMTGTGRAGRGSGRSSSSKKGGVEKGSVGLGGGALRVVVAGAAGYLAYARRDALAERWRDVVGGGRSGGFERGRFLELSEDV